MSFLDRLLGRRGADPVAEAPLRDETYRAADPRDVVEKDGKLMAGPGGTPQDGLEEPEEQEQPDQ